MKRSFPTIFMSVNILRLFTEGRLHPQVPEHRVHIEAQLAAMKVSSPNDYERYKKMYCDRGLCEKKPEPVVVQEPKHEEPEQAVEQEPAKEEPTQEKKMEQAAQEVAAEQPKPRGRPRKQ